jgi:putative hydrolase of the HAD superfamily
MKNIRHIIFDLGGVIINIDPGAVKRKLITGGFGNVDLLDRHLHDQGFFHGIETGVVGPEGFRDAVRDFLGVPMDDKAIDEVWNAMILDIPPARIRFMTRLKSRYKLYLLSNTNAIHHSFYDAYFRDTFDYPGLGAFFTQTWYSFMMGVRKPDPEIFRMALSDGRIDASETAFIDDLEENTLAAASVGIHPCHLSPGREIMDLFDEKLELII